MQKKTMSGMFALIVAGLVIVTLSLYSRITLLDSDLANMKADKTKIESELREAKEQFNSTIKNQVALEDYVSTNAQNILELVDAFEKMQYLAATCSNGDSSLDPQILAIIQDKISTVNKLVEDAKELQSKIGN